MIDRPAFAISFSFSSGTSPEPRQCHIPHHPRRHLRLGESRTPKCRPHIRNEGPHIRFTTFCLETRQAQKRTGRRHTCLWEWQVKSRCVIQRKEFVRIRRRRCREPAAPLSVQPPRAERKLVGELQSFTRRQHVPTPHIFISRSRLPRFSRTSASSRNAIGRRSTDSRTAESRTAPAFSKN